MIKVFSITILVCFFLYVGMSIILLDFTWPALVETDCGWTKFASNEWVECRSENRWIFVRRIYMVMIPVAVLCFAMTERETK